MVPQFVPLPVQPFPQSSFVSSPPYPQMQYPLVPVAPGQFIPIQPMYAFTPQPFVQQNVNQKKENITSNSKDFVELQEFQPKSLKEPVSPKAPRNVTTTSVSMSEESSFKRCSRCGKYYKETSSMKDQVSQNITGNEKECRYHPGTYKSLYHSKLGSRGWMAWSCCKNEQRESSGCKINASHIEDLTTTNSLSLFQSNLVKSNNNNNKSSPNSKPNYPLLDLDFTTSPPSSPRSFSSSVESNKSNEKKNNSLFDLKPTKIVKNTKRADVNDNNVSQCEEYIEHRVKLTDTLQGLALKYNVSVYLLFLSSNV